LAVRAQLGKYLPAWKVSGTFQTGNNCPKGEAMSQGLRPEEAAAALHEIGQRQEQVIRLAVIPTWYWWAIAVMMVGFAAAVDTQRSLAIGIGTAAFVIGVLATTGIVVVGAFRRAQVRGELLSAKGVVAILGFDAFVLGVSLPTAFALESAGVAHPATWGVLVGAVLMVTGGPILTRLLQRIMLANRIGNRA
jgi:hypothetical protein